ncbi:MAG TPA: type II secretion system F family protein [Gaiellaceae bacterium]|jgi:tight adherence protein C|nr:type II secretion system F family protein [Gaiellaceae bacterium]
MLLIAASLILAAAVYLTGEAVTAPGRERHRAIRRAATYGHVRTSGPNIERLRFHERVVGPSIVSLSRVVLRLNPRLTVENVAAKLLAAGMAGTITPTAFLASKGAAALAGGSLGVVFAASAGSPARAPLFAIVFGAVGFIAPGFYISVRGRRRREEIKAQLPDALDLLAVSVEAGLGFDGAVDKLTEHMDGALADEFALTLGEMRIGESRQDALKKMAERTATPEVASFTRAIIQADQLGISLGRLLRVQAADSREKRQAAAEEKAMKSPIKMLFPTVLFIFPAMFIVILGPAFLNLMEVF